MSPPGRAEGFIDLDALRIRGFGVGTADDAVGRRFESAPGTVLCDYTADSGTSAFCSTTSPARSPT